MFIVLVTVRIEKTLIALVLSRSSIQYVNRACFCPDRKDVNRTCSVQIEKIIQSTKKGITFQLEDSILDFSIKNYAAFVISLSQGTEYA